MPKTVFINITAAQEGGGSLTIINQFLQFFSEQSIENVKLIVFCAVPLSNFGNDNIVIISCKRQKIHTRLLWDYWGLRRWAIRHNIVPDVILSFQNTGVFFKKVPQIIYLHQSIPFSDIKWNLFKKEERSIWFYKNVYPLFIKITLFPQTQLIVQTLWMKDAVQKYFNFPGNKILLARPDCNISSDIKPNARPADGILHFFYPVWSYVYKNHLLIIKIAHLLSQRSTKNIKFHFTCTKEELPLECQQIIDKYNLEPYFVFHDKLSYVQVQDMYQNTDCLIFPSKIETVGLPLLEAAVRGMPIICADLPYARETLMEYSNVTYIPLDDIESWTKVIQQDTIQRMPHIQLQNKALKSDWEKVIQLLVSL